MNYSNLYLARKSKVISGLFLKSKIKCLVLYIKSAKFIINFRIKQLSYIPPPIQAPIQQSENSIEEEPIQPKFQHFNPIQNKNYPNSLFNMKPNFSFGKNAKDLEEEYRLLEELINTENKYHAIRFKQIITDLKSKDEYKILEAVTNLSTELSMAQEENFGSFQLDFLIPELIACLQMENPEIMSIPLIWRHLTIYSAFYYINNTYS